MFPDDYDYSKHIWGDFFIAIVSVDFTENRNRVVNLQKQLLDNNLCEGYVCLGEKVKNFSDRIDAVFECHKKIALWFNEKKPCRYVLILEDDALICTKHISSKIKKYIHDVNNYNKKWLALHLGCYALTRLYKTNQKDLYTGKGYGAHSYILNGNRIEYWLEKIKQWKIPYALEKWQSVPDRFIVMVHPMLFSQTVHCTKLHSILLPGINNPHKWYKYINFINSINIYLEEIFCVVLFLSIIYPVKYILFIIFSIYLCVLLKTL